MINSFRLSDIECEQIENKCKRVNLLLQEQSLEPITETMLLHRLIEASVHHAVISDKGFINFESENGESTTAITKIALSRAIDKG